jgi:D-alanine-D-alanine ligase-like ATP-grasp enzyme
MTAQPSAIRPDPARHAEAAARAIGATFSDLDQGGGYLFRIAKNGRSVLGGAGAICSFPVNSATALAIARDKSHTKAALSAVGLPVIPGGLFFAQTHRAALRGPGREIADAARFAEALGYPVFCKPNLGAGGNFAEIVPDASAFADYAERIAREFEAFLVEPVISGDEHRVFVQDDRAVFHSTKSPPALVGDGASTLGELLFQLNASVAGTGVSAYPPAALSLTGRAPTDIPRAGERILLPGRRNLSAAGDIEHVSTHVPPELESLAREAISTLGLRIGAVDMFDASPARDLSGLVIIEANGNPGLRTLEVAGRNDLVLDIWTRMLNELLGA